MNKIYNNLARILCCIVLLAIVIGSANGQNTITGPTNITPGGIYSNWADLTITNTGSMNNDGSHYINYNYTNNGIYSFSNGATTGTTFFAGGSNATQTLSGTGTSNFYNADFNNSNNFNLNKDIYISGNLNFANGIIYDEPGTLGIAYFNNGATYSGVADSKHVDGRVGKVGNEAFTFPIGDNGFYRPASISAPENSSLENIFVARYFKANGTTVYGTAKEATIQSVNTNEYWNINRTNGSSNPTVTLTWDVSKTSGNIPSDLTKLVIVRWDGTKWINEGNIATTGDISAGSITANVTGYGAFTFATICELEVLAFEAKSLNCIGSNDGIATLIFTGGTAPYTLSGDFTATGITQSRYTISNLAAGTYNFTVTDAGGCTATSSVTINQSAISSIDSDGDGISDLCDLDDDNDGILDTAEECMDITALASEHLNNPNAVYPNTFLMLTPQHIADRTGLAIPFSNQTFTNVDISDLFGYTAGSGKVLVSIENASTNFDTSNPNVFTGNAFNPTEFTFSGTIGVYGIVSHGRRLNIGTRDEVTIISGAPYMRYPTTLQPGSVEGIDGNTFYVENPSTTGEYYEDGMIWAPATVVTEGTWTPLEKVRFSTTDPREGKLGVGYYIQIYPECDTDKDGVPNRLDLDSDNDLCADAKEGGSELEPTNPASNQLNDGNGNKVSVNLTTTDVDANGVPTIVGAAGQTVGGSQIPATLIVDTQPEDQEVCEGSDATFTSIITVSEDQITYDYQWEVSIDNGTTWTNVTGASGTGLVSGAEASLTLNAVSIAMDGYQYRMFYNSPANECGGYTDAATLYVTPKATIINQPVSATYCQNQAVSAPLSVGAQGVGALNYQWYSNTTNTNTGGTPIAGATQSSFIPSTNNPGTQYYYAVVSGGCGSVTSNVATITINPSITHTCQYENVTCFEKNDGSLTVTVQTGTPNYKYELFKNGVLIETVSNEQSPYTFTNLPEGYYYVKVTDNNNCSVN